MMTIMLNFMLMFLIANMMMTLCMVISKKSMFDREKMSSFECGFEQKSSSRLPFSMRFFMIAIIFLIFDVEITLILPSIVNLPLSNMMNWMTLNIMFILILIIGLIHEWNQGVLEWSKY